jgi:hypothetical protein
VTVDVADPWLDEVGNCQLLEALTFILRGEQPEDAIFLAVFDQL